MPHNSQPGDFTQLDDPAFLAERARVRQLLGHQPDNAADRAEIRRLYDALTAEYDRRALGAWTTAS